MTNTASDISTKDFYSSTDISNKFDISESTLRKYSQYIERSGWIFTKNERNARVFTDSDIELLENFIRLKTELGMSLEKSADMATAYFEKNVSVTQSVSVSNDNALSSKDQKNFIQEMRSLSNEYKEIKEKVEASHQDQKQIIDAMKTSHQDQKHIIRTLQQVLDENKELRDEVNSLKESTQKKRFFGLF